MRWCRFFTTDRPMGRGLAALRLWQCLGSGNARVVLDATEIRSTVRSGAMRIWLAIDLRAQITGHGQGNCAVRKSSVPPISAITSRIISPHGMDPRNDLRTDRTGRRCAPRLSIAASLTSPVAKRVADSTAHRNVLIRDELKYMPCMIGFQPDSVPMIQPSRAKKAAALLDRFTFRAFGLLRSWCKI